VSFSVRKISGGAGETSCSDGGLRRDCYEVRGRDQRGNGWVSNIFAAWPTSTLRLTGANVVTNAACPDVLMLSMQRYHAQYSETPMQVTSTARSMPALTSLPNLPSLGCSFACRLSSVSFKGRSVLPMHRYPHRPKLVTRRASLRPDLPDLIEIRTYPEEPARRLYPLLLKGVKVFALSHSNQLPIPNLSLSQVQLT